MTKLELVDKYIEAMEQYWSYSTFKSERSRLKALGPILDLAPDAAYKALVDKELGAYTIKTTLIRLSNFHDWMVETGHTVGNPFIDFKKKVQRTAKYRNAYKSSKVPMDYSGALMKIKTMKSKQVKEHALYLLRSGLRITESYTATDKVIGKGGKERAVFGRPPTKLVKPHVLRRALKDIGLSPHMLRKLFATRLANKGMPLHQLCSVMGWSSLSTAQRYLQPTSKQVLQGAITDALSDDMEALSEHSS